MLSAKGVDVMEMFLRHEGWRTGEVREEGANGDEEEVQRPFYAPRYSILCVKK